MPRICSTPLLHRRRTRAFSGVAPTRSADQPCPSTRQTPRHPGDGARRKAPPRVVRHLAPLPVSAAEIALLDGSLGDAIRAILEAPDAPEGPA